MANKYRVAIDLGGTKIYTVLARGEEIIATHLAETPADTSSLLPFLASCVSSILKKGGVNPERLSAVGVCAAGFFDSRDRVLVSSPNLPGWKMVPLETELQKLLCVPVMAENDANAAALGEARYGAGRGFENLLYVTVSTGIGAGIICDGRIYRGSRGLAGEIGHMTVAPGGPLCGCGKRGCLEAVASGTAIGRLAGEKVLAGEGGLLAELAAGAKNITASHVFEAASRNDKTAAGIIAEAVCYLGLGLANAVNILNPQAIIIGGGVAGAGERLLLPLRTYIREMGVAAAVADLAIIKAKLGVEAGARGMLALLDQQYPELT